jgi:hypothetical protein
VNKVDAQVRKSMAAYPDLYDNRFDVLHHIFCVLGNGYEWVNGEPVEVYDDKTPWRPEEEYTNWSEYADKLPGWVDIMFERIAKNQAVIDTLDTRVADGSFENSRTALAAVETARIMGPHYGPLYTQSQSALLMNLPADIHPDWAEAAAGMRAIAETMNWKF